MSTGPAGTGARRTRVRPGPGLAAVAAVPFLLLTAAVASAWAPLLALDAAVHRWAYGLAVDVPALGRAGRIVEAVTQPVWWWVCAMAVAFVAVLRGARHTIGVLAVTIVVGGLASPVLKEVVGRRRPPLDTLLTTAEGGSFPSGHVLAATVVGGCVVLAARRVLARSWQRRLVVALWLSVVGVVVLDRLVVGAHWLSDTLGSLSLGSALLVLAATALSRRDEAPPVRPGRD